MDHQTVTCYECGAVLHAGYQSKHKQFHSDFERALKVTNEVELERERAARR